MRGFAVAAGGWDEFEEPVAPPLHLVEPDGQPVDEPPSATVVDLAEHRQCQAAPAIEREAVILAW